MKTLSLIIFFVSMTPAFAAPHNSLTDTQLLQIKFDQKLNSTVSQDLLFRDESGQQVRFGDYLGKRPVVLILGYYRCPMLCSLVINGATDSFRDMKWSIGKDFDFIFVSIDPTEKPALAAQKKETCLRVYDRPDAASGWHFLTAATNTQQGGGALQPDESVQKLADEVGFRFAYDPALKQFAHPSGFVVLTPDGKVSHYFFGVTFSPDEVDAALRNAGSNKIGSPIQEFILLCCQYSPLRGKYGMFVMDAVRAGGIATLIGLGFLLIRPSHVKIKVAK